MSTQPATVPDASAESNGASAPVPTPPKPAPPPASTKPTATLESLLEGLDADARAVILSEVSKARSEAAGYRTRLRDAEPRLSEYDRLVEASKSELERAQEMATKSAERAKSLVERAVKAEVRALAAAGFADPEDAPAFLDLSKYATPDGDVDAAAVQSDLDTLLAKKPHLRKSSAVRMPGPNPAQGSSGQGVAKPQQLSQADVKRMYADKDYDGIAKAQAEGRLSDLLGA